jgi:energy-coupling factor transporter ATP-binding protein EcfA2
MVVARETRARPVIVLNKTDLAGELGFDLEEVLRLTRFLAGGARVLPLSAMTDRSLDALAGEIAPCETAAMVGSSGVGKSTILNRLLGAELQRTSAVRAGDDRGRHTTTARELFIMPGGWLLIDMPGLREVGPGPATRLWMARSSTFRNWPRHVGFVTARIPESRGARWPTARWMRPGSRIIRRCGASLSFRSERPIRSWRGRRGRSGRRFTRPCAAIQSGIGRALRLKKRKGPGRRVPLKCRESRSYLAATASVPFACSARTAALSVASQVNSASLRPKWP